MVKQSLILFLVFVFTVGCTSNNQNQEILLSTKSEYTNTATSQEKISNYSQPKADTSRKEQAFAPQELYESVAQYVKAVQSINASDLKEDDWRLFIEDNIDPAGFVYIVVQRKWLRWYPIERLSDRNISAFSFSKKELMSDMESCYGFLDATPVAYFIDDFERFPLIPYIDAIEQGFTPDYDVDPAENLTQTLHDVLKFAVRIIELEKKHEMGSFAKGDSYSHFQIIRLTEDSFFFCSWHEESGEAFYDGSFFRYSDGKYRLRAQITLIATFGMGDEKLDILPE